MVFVKRNQTQPYLEIWIAVKLRILNNMLCNTTVETTCYLTSKLTISSRQQEQTRVSGIT